MNRSNVVLQAQFIFVIALLALLAFPLPSAVAFVSLGNPLLEAQAVILNSGSTNTCPYEIVVLLNSTATYTVCHRSGTGTLAPALTIQFFEHLVAAMPLGQLPRVSCLKPTSFATTTLITYAKDTTPDISCPERESRLIVLFADTLRIQSALGFSLSP